MTDFAARVMLALGPAGHSALLTWQEIEYVQTLVEHFEEIDLAMFWAVYQSLGGEARQEIRGELVGAA